MQKNGFWERLFPVKRDFYKMLSDQAKATSNVAKGLLSWLNSRTKEDYSLLVHLSEESDRCRFAMEEELIEAFATPFDRQDIYSLSIEMGRIVEYSDSTQKEMESFGVGTTQHITSMVEQLIVGTRLLSEAIEQLKDDPRKSEMQIGEIRKVQKAVEEEYRIALAGIFSGDDVMGALKYKEVYHHIKDAAGYLGRTTDILHRIIVRLV